MTDALLTPERMQHYKRSYLLWLTAAGYKPDTIERASRVSNSYMAFCQSSDTQYARRDSITGYLAAAAKRGVRPHTLLNYWKDLRLGFTWAVSEGLVVENPMAAIPKPRPSLYERERDVSYSEEEFEALKSVMPTWNSLGARDRAIVCALWSTGMRASELCNLKVEDIDDEEGVIRVNDGKDGVNYSCLLPPECEQNIRRYLMVRPQESEWLFLARHGGKLTRHGLEQMLRRQSQRAGWKQACFPHGFRHSFRIRMRKLGLDDTDTAALMGHRTVRSTYGYGRRQAAESALARLRRVLERSQT